MFNIKKMVIPLLLCLVLISATGCFRKEPVLEDKPPLASIEMENGSIIEIELYPEIAPNTVRNFIELAQEGFYDGLIFHRVIPGFMIQGGCPEETGFGDPGYSIAGEFNANDFENDLSHIAGTISMARTPDDLDSAGSQFFITVADVIYLDGEYAAFGRVVSGLEVAQEIANVPNDENDKPLEPQRIKKVKVDTHGRKFGPAGKIRR